MRRVLVAAGLVVLAAVALIEGHLLASPAAMFFGFRSGDGNDSHYLFWSGAGSHLAYLSVVAAAYGLYRKNNCKKRWCWRIGKHEFCDPATGVTRMLCWVHHPDVHHKTLTTELIEKIHLRQHQKRLDDERGDTERRGRPG